MFKVKEVVSFLSLTLIIPITHLSFRHTPSDTGNFDDEKDDEEQLALSLEPEPAELKAHSSRS